jgi:hypothetical protein
MESRSIADLEGPWVDPDFESGLIERCRRNWNTPVSELSNQVLATFLRQRFGLEIVIPEARRRVASGYDDDSELYDGELEAALRDAAGLN